MYADPLSRTVFDASAQETEKADNETMSNFKSKCKQKLGHVGYYMGVSLAALNSTGFPAFSFPIYCACDTFS